MKLLKRKKSGRTLLSFFLTLAMVVGLMPGMSLTAYADNMNLAFTSENATVELLDSTAQGQGEFWKITATKDNTSVTITRNSLSVAGSYTMDHDWQSCVKIGDSPDYFTGGDFTVAVSDTNVVTVSGTFTSSSNTYSISITYTPPAHAHNFSSYTASGATITATCDADGCGLTDSKATLTLSAADATYTGSAYTGASLSDTTAWTAAGLTAPTIEYAGRGSTSYTKSATAPTNAGTYTASITVDTNKTATADFTISPMPLTITGATATNRAYDKDSTAVTISAVTFKDSNDQNVALTLGESADYTVTGAMTNANAGDGKTVNVTVTLKNANYSLATNTTTTTVNISKANNPATVTNAASVTKGGNTVDLANNVTLNDATGAVSYEISGEANGCSLNGSVLTSGDNTGSVTVNVTVAEDVNYNALAATPITVSISDKGTQTISAENVTVAYGDTDKKVTATTDGNGEISYAVKDGSADYIDVNASTGALTIKKVGTATVIVTAAETATYTQATKEVTVTINKANAIPATVTANNRTYDGTEKPLVTVAGEPTGGTMQYALGTATEAIEPYTTSIPTATNAGTYYVWYKAVGDENHIDSDAAYVAVVIKRLVQCTVTFKVVNGDWNDGTNTDKTVTLSGGEGEALKLTADQVPAVGNKPGGAYVGGSWDNTPSTETAITKDTTYTYTYGDKAENPATVRDTATVMKGGKTVDLAENVTLNGATGAVSYSLSGDAGGCSLNGSILTSGSAANTVYVNVTVAEDDNYKALDAKRITVSVTDKPLQVLEAEDVSVTYGETDKKVTATVTTPATGGGAITYAVKDGSGDYIDVDASTGLLTVKAVPADGKAYVTAKAAETDTYAEATKDVTITIAQAPVTPKVELNKTALSLTVNEESTLTATIVPEGQQVTWTSSDAAIAEVDTTGKVTAKAAGTAKVTATITVEGQEYKAECDVTVTAPAPTPVPSETIVVPEALSDDSLSPEIVERYGSVEQVTVILQETMGVTPESRGNSSVFDAQVVVIVDGQARPATVDDITPEGLEAVFPYPDGTNKDNFIFSGAHMIGETAGGYQAGDIEGLSFTNADDGLHTRIHGLSPVIITWTAAAPGEAPQVDRHVHVYEWDTINATADQDGEMRYQCRICGDIQTRVPITAYYIFNKETTEKIRRAKQGETVKIETARWISFHKMVMEALADRPDVTLEVSFLDEGHKGTRKSFTIPVGTDTKSLVDDKGFAGFIYLTNKFGNTVTTP